MKDLTAALTGDMLKRILLQTPPDQRKALIDTILDFIEDTNKDNESIKMLCRVIRLVLDVPDNDPIPTELHV